MLASSEKPNDLVGTLLSVTCLPFAVLCHALFEDMAVKVASWGQELGAHQT